MVEPHEGRRADLARALADFRPADAAELRHRQAMLQLLACPGDVFSRRHHQPGHFTASAFVLDARGERLLLIHHAKLGRWLQPGGHVDPDDADLAAAARRELAEEAGLTRVDAIGSGPFDLDVHAIPALNAEPAHLHFDVRYLFRARGDALRAGSDAKAARWSPLEAIGPTESDASVLRARDKLLHRAFGHG
ncbi:MAG: NUDIX domain-containing protein [Caldilineae bacterium]|nr:NUDIX domain-containing protein [Chloroflexota bacterium]MCB9176216.1 NUDIX domain-containing protein [Caldilineae bacterium]